jgi:hypothetical protein
MSPGRASAASMTCRLSCLASACWTQVCTAAQPVPFILWPDCSSDHVTKLAHHGLPGPTLAAARYLSTSAPVLTPCSCTPSCVCATFSAAAPTLLAPEPGAAAAAASTIPGTDAAEATALGGPAGGWTARKEPEPFFASTTWAAAAMNWPESPAFGSGGGTAPGGAAAGAPATAGAGATAPGAAGATAAAAAAGCAPLAATSPGGDQLGSISFLNPRCRWSWCAPSVK